MVGASFFSTTDHLNVFLLALQRSLVMFSVAVNFGGTSVEFLSLMGYKYIVCL